MILILFFDTLKPENGLPRQRGCYSPCNSRTPATWSETHGRDPSKQKPAIVVLDALKRHDWPCRPDAYGFGSK